MEDNKKKLRDYLMNKFSSDQRQKLVDETENQSSGANWAAGLAGIGATLQGRNAMQAGMDVVDEERRSRQEKLDSFDSGKQQVLSEVKLENELTQLDDKQKEKAQLEDPNSERSRLAQVTASKMMPGKDFSGMSAAQLEGVMPSIAKIYQIDQSRAEKQEKRAERSHEKDLARQEKLDKEQRKIEQENKETMVTIEDRRRNIKDNLALLKKQVQEKGTYEMFGSHNADIERRIDQIATDMAKLTDPNSVARPSEVEMFKRGLFEPGLGVRNSTALNILDNFESEVDKRADNAYNLRGVENPEGRTQEAGSQFPMKVRKDGKVATVNNKEELEEAKQEGWK
jgi:hypothetical protein